MALFLCFLVGFLCGGRFPKMLLLPTEDLGGLPAGRKPLLTPRNFPGSVEDVGPLPIAEVGIGEEKRGCERLWFDGGSPIPASGNCLLSSGARKRHNIPEGHICPWVLTM